MRGFVSPERLPLLATAGVFAGLFGVASLAYPGFFSSRVVANLFADNATLGIAAVGMTFVILSGGIDLSVGSVMAWSTVLVAVLVGRREVHPLAAWTLALGVGTLFGLGQGFLIQRFALPPFLVTLGGLFFARGMAFVLSLESTGIRHGFYDWLLEMRVPLGRGAGLPATALAWFVVLGIAVLVARWTMFGRQVYVLGGSPEAAGLMGLPVAWTRMGVYGLNGFCAALAGVVGTWYTGSGNPAMGSGMELDAIAAVVIGGTRLAGGVGCIEGTLLGVLIFGTIQSALVFDGRLNSWWLRIVIGALLLVFIILQKTIATRAAGGRHATA